MLPFKLSSFLLVFSCNVLIAQTESDRNKVLRYLEMWRKSKIENKAYIHPDSCQLQYIINNQINSLETFGLPEKVNISWGDLNLDGTEDALIIFHPMQCDGGNGSMKFQYALLIISNENEYYFLEHYPSTNLGMGGYYYYYNSIEKNGINASYYEYKNEDSRCCPSIRKEHFLEFKEGHLYLNEHKLN